MTGAIVQAVLGARYWALSKNVVACTVIGACWLSGLGGAFVSAVWVARFPSYEDRGKLTIPVTIYLSQSLPRTKLLPRSTSHFAR